MASILLEPVAASPTPIARPMAARLRISYRKRDGIALLVSNTVGVGIFTTPLSSPAWCPTLGRS